MINKSARRAAGVAVVLAATAAVLPVRGYEPADRDADLFAQCLTDPAVFCSVSYGTGEAVPAPIGVAHPPTLLATNGVPGCASGPARPVVDTTGPALSIIFPADRPAPPEVTFEWQHLDGSEDPIMGSREASADRTFALEAQEIGLGAGLGPGESYRWRVHTTPWDADVTEWTQWCEFTVAAGLVDLREATDLAAVQELGVVPARRYPVRLSVRQWRLVTEVLDGGDDGADHDFDGSQQEIRDRLRRISASLRQQTSGGRTTVTLTGDEWASTAEAVAGMAVSWDMMYEEEPEVGSDGTAYWTVVDRISADLGGPAHPGLGAER
ncbi:hypothetical protein [Actinoplanes aureus]|uniref:Uncharacterized protein n=1 Tax=Actinoplanes aureus TaxID=2792083 RepID=A0A931G2W7_9ACTN|nr:hypothetical protein [Actinoplanes aureus]MBG0568197.1 hypothetical protein [Actinoplanes aureus]